jgi:hypothetical protein
MKELSLLLGVCLFLVACGQGPPANLTIYLDPPLTPDGGDDLSCIGVVGFEITVSSKGTNASSGPVTNLAPILNRDRCKLDKPIQIPSLDPEASAIVTVTGYDSGRGERVRGSMNVNDLRGGATHLALAPSGSPPPVMVIDKNQLLGSAGFASDVTVLEVSTVMRPMTWFKTDVGMAGPYFSRVDPGAFGFGGLTYDGLNAGTSLDIAFTLNDGGMPIRKRVTLNWMNPYYQAQ